MTETLGNVEMQDKITKGQKIMDDLTIDKRVTEEEFQNFMHRVTEVEKIVKKLASDDPEEQKHGQILADEMLETKSETFVSEDCELKVKSSRTVINKSTTNETNNREQMSQEAFMRSIEKDAKERAEDRRIRNERAETLKRIGNGAFKEGSYEKAVTYYTKALEQRKDSSVLWNNRALSYIQLGLFEKALADCEWALKVHNANMKALLNSARCYKHLGDKIKYKEYIQLARERNPRFDKFIDEFEENMDTSIDYQV
ncbi:PREDICTED: tetratricopeptide repeat protein 12-like [Dufourea novaeangliae]|uniref:Tetratricopeptide repeat protein 12 n=1 Tax=Dufourea novaeangliae TaxID=178035 RepID=A0A154PB67_DUFNO|nr:PREDICTED: tetratricopeptide repeat protein 12-like [Dufourea novaeangliae]KZC08634.1 Tetratricopeptide repeat protein 12 [Dufourea novaeangliae]